VEYSSIRRLMGRDRDCYRLRAQKEPGHFSLPTIGSVPLSKL
jgi:hypothetical protein